MFRVAAVPNAEELIERAFRRARRSMIRRGRSPAERARNAAANQVRTASNVLESTLRGIVRSVPTLDRLPPFPKDLVDAIVGVDRLRNHLGAIEWAAGQVRRIASETLVRIGPSPPTGVVGLRRAALGRMASVVHQVAGHLEALGSARAKLHAIPDIDLSLPTIVVAGAPNVGKSAFVRAISSGRPKVASYPFTTQRLALGHFERSHRKYQVVDTPGLLDRPLEQRNPAERQAVAALRHLAHIVVFLLDPSETCGTPLSDQEKLLSSVGNAFSAAPMVVVENKVDLYRSDSDRLKVSATTGTGVQKVVEAALRRLTSHAPAAEPPAVSR